MLAMAGINYNTDNIRSITNCLIDGKLSPIEMVTMTFKMTPLLMKLNDLIKQGKNSFLAYYLDGVEELTGSIIALILFAMAILITIFAGIKSLLPILLSSTDKRSRFYFWQLLLITVISFVIVLAIQDEDLDLSLTVWPFIALALSYPYKINADGKLNLGNSEQVDAVLEKISFGSIDTQKIKSNVERVGRNVKNSSAYTQISDNANLLKKNVKNRIIQAAENVSWRCPVCGNLNGSGNKFCSQCGSGRPEKPKCPNCGMEIVDNSPFCSNCGAILKKDDAVRTQKQNATPPSKNTEPDDFDEFLLSLETDDIFSESKSKQSEEDIQRYEEYKCPVCKGKIRYKQDICRSCNTRIRWE